MENLAQLVADKVELMKQGKMVEATEQFFAENAETFDFTGVTTKSRQEMVDKMKGFLGSIKNVNEISIPNSGVSGDVSFIELKVDFDMADGSKIDWHEIIRSYWKDGKIVREQFFKA